MKYFWGALGYIFRNKMFVAVALGSTLFFFILFFPFSDLSNAVTSAVASATGNQVYLQAESINLHLLPQPAVSATNLSLETNLPRLEAQWAKVTPSIFSILFSLPTVIQAARGNPEASRALPSKIGLSVDAEGILGGELSVKLRSGSKSEQGRERSRVSLTLESVGLKDVQEWAGLDVPMTGKADVESDVAYVPSFEEQPEGDYQIEIDKFVLPASNVPTPMGPLAVPTITLAKVVLRGRLVGGNLIIEEGQFGQSNDPLYGRIKGQMAMTLQPMGPNIVPNFGAYNFTVEINANALILRDLSIAFILLDSAKESAPGGGAKYLFRATGQGLGPPPSINRVSTF